MKLFHPSRRDLRLASGLVLFAYVTLHFVNHSLGLVSIAVAERGLALTPVLGGLGFFAMSKELAADLANRGQLEASIALPTAGNTFLQRVREDLLGLYLLAIASVFAARGIRAWVERRFRTLVSIQYPQRTVRVPRGWTVLEASRSHRLPHVALCGGRARCSTCRVRLTRGEDRCPAPGPMEQATLARIQAGAGIRLASQLRPNGDIAIVPLLRPRPHEPEQPHARLSVEQEVVLVCVDWRGPRSMHEGRTICLIATPRIRIRR